jgi:hypothetical protein
MPEKRPLISYNGSSIDPNNEVKPRLNRKLYVRVAQHLKAKRATFLLTLMGGVTVQAGHESVESVEHGAVS